MRAVVSSAIEIPPTRASDSPSGRLSAAGTPRSSPAGSTGRLSAKSKSRIRWWSSAPRRTKPRYLPSAVQAGSRSSAAVFTCGQRAADAARCVGRVDVAVAIRDGLEADEVRPEHRRVPEHLSRPMGNGRSRARHGGRADRSCGRRAVRRAGRAGSASRPPTARRPVRSGIEDARRRAGDRHRVRRDLDRAVGGGGRSRQVAGQLRARAMERSVNVAKPAELKNGELPLISQRPSELSDGVVRSASEN